MSHRGPMTRILAIVLVASVSMVFVPPAAYRLAIETETGLYEVGVSLPLAAGQHRNVSLALDPGAADDPESANKAAYADAKMGFMDNPLFASMTVIGAAILFGFLISEIDDSNEGIASPFIN